MPRTPSQLNCSPSVVGEGLSFTFYDLPSLHQVVKHYSENPVQLMTMSTTRYCAHLFFSVQDTLKKLCALMTLCILLLLLLLLQHDAAYFCSLFSRQ